MALNVFNLTELPQRDLPAHSRDVQMTFQGQLVSLDVRTLECRLAHRGAAEHSSDRHQTGVHSIACHFPLETSVSTQVI